MAGTAPESMKSVLEWFERRLTASTRRSQIVLPRRFAGWVLSADADVAESDGLRPLGAIRDDLDALIGCSALTAQERTVLRVRYGLDGPNRVVGGSGVAARVPVERIRSRHGLGERRLRIIVRDAVAKLDTTTSLREGSCDVPSGLAPDPIGSPWLQRNLRISPDAARILRDGRAHAATFASAGTFGIDTGDALVAEVDEWFARYELLNWRSNRPLGGAPVRAVAGIGLWMASTGSLAAPKVETIGVQHVGPELWGSNESLIVSSRAIGQQNSSAEQHSSRSTRQTLTPFSQERSSIYFWGRSGD